VFSKLMRLYHTIKPLRFEQIYYRILYRLLPLRRVKCDVSAVTPATWVWSGPEVVERSIICHDEVKFLSQQVSISNRSVWNDSSHEKLWLYNLHYFDDLNALDSLYRKDMQYSLVRRWIAENPPVSGNGWEPYPISLRLVNWTKWYNRAEIDDKHVIKSIGLQVKALSKQLEYHILGNHLFANAKALVFSGCFLGSKDGDKYLRLGLELLDREIPEQFLDDGGHFELSPMYHSILLWDLLDLINLATISGGPLLKLRLPEWRAQAVKALEWLDVMTHGDGEISFFNDATIGIAASPKDLKDYAVQLGLTSDYVNRFYRSLKNTGYSRINNSMYCLLFDHGAVGPSYLPGHAHADTLSFELSVGNHRFFVNSGTSLYGLSNERHRQRGTAAHNTVVIDGADSSEVWGGFRVAKRANVSKYKVDLSVDAVVVSAQHDGYLRLKGGVIHTRVISASDNMISIHDRVTGSYKSALSFYHLHPDIKVKEISDGRLELTSIFGDTIIFSSTGPIKIESTSYHPAFGVSISNKRLVVPLISDSLVIGIEIKKGLMS